MIYIQKAQVKAKVEVKENLFSTLASTLNRYSFAILSPIFVLKNRLSAVQLMCYRNKNKNLTTKVEAEVETFLVIRSKI
jgi:hypothetical protein